MKKIFSLVLFVTAVTVANAQPPKVPANPGDHFGAKTTADNALSVEQMVNNIKGKKGPVDVKIKGKVTEVCQAMGCWIKVQSTSGDMTVRMKEHSFFVPVVLSGKTVVIEGTAEEKTTSVAELKDVAEDAGKSKAEVAKITAPKKEIVVQAKGILVL